MPALTVTSSLENQGQVPSDRELKEWGIERYSAGKFELLVDQVGSQEGPLLQSLIQQLARLPRFFEQKFAVYLLPAQNGTEQKLTGHLMRDQQVFLNAGLLPEEFADLSHGKELGTKFWINDQPTTYYREHLLIHEAVHGLMNQQSHGWPIWFLEGIAEYIACHEIHAEGDWEFAVVPSWEIVEQGFGRIALLQQECRAGRWQDFAQVRQLDGQNFYPQKTSYAWSWAMCLFLAEHPQTGSTFKELLRQPEHQRFDEALDQLLKNGGESLLIDWTVFLYDLIPDYSFVNNQVSFPADKNSLPMLTGSTSLKLDVQTNWQYLPVTIPAAKKLKITAAGRYEIDDDPVVWMCEPNGVSIDYHQGYPLGQLQAVIVPIAAQPGEYAERFFHPLEVGLEQDLLTDFPALLFFRINDRGSDRGNNRGTINIVIEPQQK